MEDARRAQIKVIVEHFLGKTVTQDNLNEFTNLNKFELVTLGDYQDYLYQYEQDKTLAEMFPLVLEALKGLKYMPEFADASERKAIKEGNDVVRIKIAQIFEDYALKYRAVDSIARELAQMISGTVEMAGTTIFNKALEVLMLVAKDKFGGEFNVKHAKEYAESLFKNKK